MDIEPFVDHLRSFAHWLCFAKLRQTQTIESAGLRNLSKIVVSSTFESKEALQLEMPGASPLKLSKSDQDYNTIRWRTLVPLGFIDNAAKDEQSISIYGHPHYRSATSRSDHVHRVLVCPSWFGQARFPFSGDASYKKNFLLLEQDYRRQTGLSNVKQRKCRSASFSRLVCGSVGTLLYFCSFFPFPVIPW